MDRPSHVYEDTNSLWAFYNYVTIALQHSHPKTWMEDQRVLHYFISTVNNFQQCNTPAQIVTPIAVANEAEVVSVDPNQVDLEDLIAEVEAEKADTDTIITYTDPAGNTFETVDFHSEVVSDTNQLEDPRDEEEDLNDWMNLPLETTPEENNTPPYEPADDQEYTGENASYMSLEVSPQDRDQAEVEIIKLDEKDASEDANLDDLIFNIEDEDEDDSSDFF